MPCDRIEKALAKTLSGLAEAGRVQHSVPRVIPISDMTESLDSID